MKQIGFKNFRKFENFPVMDLAPITILVGGNNAGKSTLVKAILLINDFFKNTFRDITNDGESLLNNRFFFDKNYYTHIGTIKRSICNHSNSKEIEFFADYGEFSVRVSILQDDVDDNATSGLINRIIAKDNIRSIEYDIDFLADSIVAKFNVDSSKAQPNEALLRAKEDLKKLTQEKKEEKNLENVANIDAKIKDLKSYTRYLTRQNKGINEARIINTTITGGYRAMIGGPLLELVLYKLISLNEVFDKDGNVRMGRGKAAKKTDLSQEDISFLLKYENQIRSSIHLFDGFSLFRNSIEYIYAHSASQMIIYNSKDSNDYLVKTIHEFANLRVQKGDKANLFIKKWMKIFGIGKDYELQSVGGEAHVLKIEDENGETVYLADKGMGSIQLMILLLRLATFIGNRKIRISSSHNRTIIVEEPEQNLHPRLQSKLVDLFAELNKEYGFRFIIETHSEYLVRKTQVLVKESNYSNEEDIKANCPFKVYYFPEDGTPYSMEYRTDGKFANEFGTGFFDEANKLIFDIL